MQIVISVPEEMYTRLKISPIYYFDDGEDLCVAVKRGMPLPDGHGDLIDRNDLYEWMSEADDNMILDALSEGMEIDELPAVIRADY